MKIAPCSFYLSKQMTAAKNRKLVYYFEMKKYSALIVLFLAMNVFAQTNPDPRRCQPEKSGEIPVYSNDFKWGLSLADVKSLSGVMYDSQKRLAKRAYYDETLKTLVFPYDSSRGGNVKIPAAFLKAVQRHVEKSFERNYIDAVMFPDMGHSHFLIPEALYKKQLDPIPPNQFNQLYEKMFNMKEMKVVYHTAEQLSVMDGNKKLLDDKKLQWRYYTRNLVGQNLPEPDLELVNATATSDANTMGEADMPGYHWWGAGFNIHANKNGCIGFKKGNQIMYFDLSLYDLESEPGTGGDQ